MKCSTNQKKNGKDVISEHKDLQRMKERLRKNRKGSF
jgi:hypothetical protein